MSNYGKLTIKWVHPQSSDYKSAMPWESKENHLPCNYVFEKLALQEILYADLQISKVLGAFIPCVHISQAPGNSQVGSLGRSRMKSLVSWCMPGAMEAPSHVHCSRKDQGKLVKPLGFTLQWIFNKGYFLRKTTHSNVLLDFLAIV